MRHWTLPAPDGTSRTDKYPRLNDLALQSRLGLVSRVVRTDVANHSCEVELPRASFLHLDMGGKWVPNSLAELMRVPDTPVLGAVNR